MMLELFPGLVLLILYLVGGIFFLLWPILIWSHLREHTKTLREIRDLLQRGR